MRVARSNSPLPGGIATSPGQLHSLHVPFPGVACAADVASATLPRTENMQGHSTGRAWSGNSHPCVVRWRRCTAFPRPDILMTRVLRRLHASSCSPARPGVRLPRRPADHSSAMTTRRR